ncbi:MAG: TonB family protein [Croceibacterium sp.]
MSYVTKRTDPQRRRIAVIGVIAIHALLGYALVNGLTYATIIEKLKNPEGTLIEDFPLPAPTPTPTETVDPVIDYQQAPLPPKPLAQPPGPRVDVVDPFADVLPTVPRTGDTGLVAIPTPQPRPSPSFTARSVRPSNNQASWITTDDYPRRSLVDGHEGTARYRLVISTSGKVTSCDVTQTTGDRALDDATCRFIIRRARFDPATDENGAKVVGTYAGIVHWDIPE